MTALKVGDTVYPCYDGKSGRKCAGLVLKIRAQSVLVQFTPYITSDVSLVKVWFRRRKCKKGETYYSAYLVSADSFMRRLFGMRGDYYAFYAGKNSKEEEA